MNVHFCCHCSTSFDFNTFCGFWTHYWCDIFVSSARRTAAGRWRCAVGVGDVLTACRKRRFRVPAWWMCRYINNSNYQSFIHYSTKKNSKLLSLIENCVWSKSVEFVWHFSLTFNVVMQRIIASVPYLEPRRIHFLTLNLHISNSGTPTPARAWDIAPYSWNMVNLFLFGCHVTDRAYVRARLQIVRVG